MREGERDHTWSPSDMSTMSPGTSSEASITVTLPSRHTLVFLGMSFLKPVDHVRRRMSLCSSREGERDAVQRGRLMECDVWVSQTWV
jgi:hypothetical protein